MGRVRYSGPVKSTGGFEIGAAASGFTGETNTTAIDSDGYLYQAGTKVTASASELNTLDGITASTSELNVLDGITASTSELNTKTLTVKMDDVSTAGSVYVVSPYAGTLSRAYSVIDGAIATADAVLTLNVNGGTDITNTITIAYDGSAAGDVDSCTPDDNNTVSVGDYIKITTNGASTNTVAATITLVITL